MKVFLDSNILVYGLVGHLTGFVGDPREKEKRRIAAELITGLGDTANLAISAQVMGEFFVVTTRKGRHPISPAAAASCLDRIKRFEVVSVDSSLIFHAVLRAGRNQISYWDALIVEAALRAGASVLYSEDMQHGMRFGSMQVINPFLPAP